MSTLSRRRFLRGAALTAGGLSLAGPLTALSQREAAARPGRGRGPRGDALLAPDNGGYGPLVEGSGDLWLPAGFSFVAFGRTGELMSDGRPTPSAHDGMAAFPGPEGTVRLVRNHELSERPPLDPARAYDTAAGGGTVTLDFNPDAGELVRSFVSLSGTIRNCAGGPTPWGSWLSCEETTASGSPTSVEGFLRRDHGYVFEVDAAAQETVEPVALDAMGRFSHEACAIDVERGEVLLTEDAGASGFFRFVPEAAELDVGALQEGGRLFMLAVDGRRAEDLRTGQYPGKTYPVRWVPIAEPDPDLGAREDSCYVQGLQQGGATFARGEGCWAGEGAIYFTATSGGDAGLGQVFEYRPDGDGSTGVLRLLYESPAQGVLDFPDNCTVSPGGAVVLCEDGSGEDFVRAVTPEGRLFTFARNNLNDSEFGGATFSPDGLWMFVNIQSPGITYAITGPWENGVL